MTSLTKPVTPEDHIQGPEDAPVTLIEYGDFQCPHCGAAYFVLKEVQERMGDRLRFVYRHFPISQSHEYAMPAAEASESAAAQGKFWEMHDYIFEHQDLLDRQHLPQFAEAIGLSGDQVRQDLENHTYEDQIQEDFMGGVRSGVNGTPSLFINGERYNGPVALNQLLRALEESAKSCTKLSKREEVVKNRSQPLLFCMHPLGILRKNQKLPIRFLLTKILVMCRILCIIKVITGLFLSNIRFFPFICCG